MIRCKAIQTFVVGVQRQLTREDLFQPHVYVGEFSLYTKLNAAAQHGTKNVP